MHVQTQYFHIDWFKPTWAVFRRRCCCFRLTPFPTFIFFSSRTTGQISTKLWILFHEIILFLDQQAYSIPLPRCLPISTPVFHSQRKLTTNTSSVYFQVRVDRIQKRDNSKQIIKEEVRLHLETVHTCIHVCQFGCWNLYSLASISCCILVDTALLNI